MSITATVADDFGADRAPVTAEAVTIATLVHRERSQPVLLTLGQGQGPAGMLELPLVRDCVSTAGITPAIAP